MYLLFLYFSLTNFIWSFIAGRFLSVKACLTGFIFFYFISFLLTFFIFYEVSILHFTCYIDLGSWVFFNNLVLNWSFLFDVLSSLMLLVILSISFFANIYSLDYMEFDPCKIRFFCNLSFFTFTMLLLVTSNSLLQLFMGWELVGLSSYLLINHWYTRIQANKSSLLAVFVNKVGDIFLLFLGVLLYSLYKNFDLYSIFLCYDFINDDYFNCISNVFWNDKKIYFISEEIDFFIISKNKYFIWEYYLDFFKSFLYGDLICFFIFLASICKSAQSGFHFWLAEAMEGPTPVSSLLHAATMVTAGVFLIVRCNIFFTNNYLIPMLILLFGSITSFFASLIGLFQNDLKKIIAFSTCSQLGYMFCSCGMGNYDYAMYHLFNHAFFKALLFLASGYVIHIFLDEQDIRRYGSIIKIVPLPYISFFIGSFSLMGIPFFSGFYSKDLIIEKIGNLDSINFSNTIFYDLYYISSFLIYSSIIFTVFYSIKLFFYLFLNSYNGFYRTLLNVNFSTYYTTIPLFLLCILSISSGYFFSELMVGLGNNFWNNIFKQIFFLKTHFYLNHSFFFSGLPFEYNKYFYYVINFIIFYYIIISLIYFNFYFFAYSYIEFFKKQILNINNKFFLFNRVILKSLILYLYNISYKIMYKLIDKNILEVLGPLGIVNTFSSFHRIIKQFHSGFVYHYSGLINLFILILLTLLINFYV